MNFSRADHSRLTEWWFSIDWSLLIAILFLVGAGLVLSLSASPTVAFKKDLPAYYFVERHFLHSVCGVGLLIFFSFLAPRHVRRVSLALVILTTLGLVAVYFAGKEINGARRWLSFLGHSLQPSEFLKPGFVVISAWLLAEARSRKDMPGLFLAILLFIISSILLIIQPDVGQTLLLSFVWVSLFFVSGQPIFLGVLALGFCGLGLVMFYVQFPHVKIRIDRFLNPMPGDNSQVDRALHSFGQGGFWGRGPGEGTIKTALPDAHTDFIYAVIAEEYGAIACLGLLLLFGFIVVRALYLSAQKDDLSQRLGILGLALLFGAQSIFNMAVSVGLLPAKGITLPYLSVGGSSTLGVSITLGMLLSLTRRSAGTED
ncbi:MAG: FtsW/RodA/SpoVE family cell cycle protein [Hyphomicrobium sp.]